MKQRRPRDDGPLRPTAVALFLFVVMLSVATVACQPVGAADELPVVAVPR
ncbi:MAG: hypothetical protein IPM99_12750 [Rubrivivax sp.]|nr:hypothetical protein [Rubrivivax sp.]